MSSLAPLPISGASRVVFLGTPEIAVPYLEALVASGVGVELVVTRPDVRRGRGNEVSASPVKVAAQNLGLTVSHDVSDVLGVAKDNSGLLGVVVAFGELICKLNHCIINLTQKVRSDDVEQRAGRKIKVGSGNTEYACFIPAPLPPQSPVIQYDDELIYLISEANRYIGKLD